MFYNHIGQTCRLDGKWSPNWDISAICRSRRSTYLEDSSLGLFCSTFALGKAMDARATWFISRHFAHLEPFQQHNSIKSWQNNHVLLHFSVLQQSELVQKCLPGKSRGVPTLPECSELCCCQSRADPSAEHPLGTSLGCSAPCSPGQGTQKWPGHTHGALSEAAARLLR